MTHMIFDIIMIKIGGNKNMTLSFESQDYAPLLLKSFDYIGVSIKVRMHKQAVDPYEKDACLGAISLRTFHFTSFCRKSVSFIPSPSFFTHNCYFFCFQERMTREDQINEDSFCSVLLRTLFPFSLPLMHPSVGKLRTKNSRGELLPGKVSERHVTVMRLTYQKVCLISPLIDLSEWNRGRYTRVVFYYRCVERCINASQFAARQDKRVSRNVSISRPVE